MNVLLIDNFDSFTFNLAQVIEEAAPCRISVVQYDQVNSTILSQCDKIVISPGFGIPDDFPDLEHYIRQYHTSKSILGVCLGLEAIGMAFGVT
jgi:anthranilate synthase component II